MAEIVIEILLLQEIISDLPMLLDINLIILWTCTPVLTPDIEWIDHGQI